MSHVRNAKQHKLFINIKSKYFKLFHNGYLQKQVTNNIAESTMNVLLPYRKMDIGISAVHILEYLVKRTNKLWKEANTKNDVHNKF